MIKTTNYFLEAFIDGDAYSSLADRRRFETIDNQTNRIIELAGDGRIDGWEIQTQVFPNVLVTSGNGIVDKYYVNTFNDQLFELEIDGMFFFFAQRRVGIIGTIGPRSDLISITYADAGPPATPSGFAALLVDSFTISLSWNTNSEADFDHYELERATDGGATTLFELDTGVTSFVDDVEENAEHRYKLYAVDQSGKRSIPADAAVTTPLDPNLPPNPEEVTMPPSEAAINILWKRPIQLAFAKIDHWILTYVKLDNGDVEIESTRVIRNVNKNLFNDRIDDLVDGQKYRVTLQTADTQGRISEGISRIAIPQPNAAPRDPQAIAFGETDLGSSVEVALSWTDGDTPYDPKTSYRFKIYITVDEQQESLAIEAPIGNTEEQVSLYTFDFNNYFSIPYSTLITFRITSVSVDGFESFGNYIRFVSSNFSTFPPVQSLTSQFDFDTKQLVATWLNPSGTINVHIKLIDEDLNSDPVPDEYGVIDLVTVDEFIGPATKFEIDGDLDHRYTMAVTPYNIEGIKGPPAITVALSTFAGGLPLPEPPTNVEAQIGDKQIRLTWDASSTLYTTTVKLYRHLGQVSFDPLLWDLVDTIPNTITSFTDYGLENLQEYSYYITAFDVYSRESLHLPDDAINLNFVEATPLQQGLLTAPEIIEIKFDGTNIIITWDTLLEEFDAFTIYRSVNNLHSFEELATVDKNTFTYTDASIPLVDGNIFYYLVDKSVNDADIVVQSSNISPENSIFLGKITLNGTSFGAIDISERRDIKDLIDPIAEFTQALLLPHKHREIGTFDPDRIGLNVELIVTDWTSVDGRIFFTTEKDILGTSFILKIDGRFPKTFFTIDAVNRRIVFSEPITEIDEDGNIVGTIPDIELRILGLEEVQNVLDAFRFDKIHARQVQFGTLNKEQLPDINHEGRIRETMLAKNFLLQRFSNHVFTVPEESTDTTKNFGEGTAFFTVIESDGQIEDVIDFDLEDVGDLVGFRKPSFSPTTFMNLKQVSLENQVDGPHDDAYQENDLSWFPDEGKLRLGKSSGGSTRDIFLRFKIDVPVGATITSAKIIFTSQATSSRVKCRTRISIFNPDEFNQSIGLSAPLPLDLPTLGEVAWEVPPWDSGESSENTTTPDFTTMMQSFIDKGSYFLGSNAFVKIDTIDDFTDLGATRVALAFEASPTSAARLQLTYTAMDIAEVDSDTGGFQSLHSYHVMFDFEDSEPTRWVRLTTFETAISPNPVIKLGKRLRLRVLLKKGSVYLGLGLREITIENPAQPPAVGSNGGTTGPIEWVAVDSVVSDEEGNIAPRGVLITANDEWQEIDIDLPKAAVMDFENGNGILSPDFGVLEHFALTVDPDGTDPTAIDIYFDEIEQIDDVMVAGTSQGILISNDFGTSWELARFTDTPVHKFYRAKNNGFIWALTADEVLIAVDPAFWFATSGTVGIQYIRDIVEDHDGNMFVSTDKGVYWFEIALINTFATWRQTKPITPFTSDCYGMYSNFVSSGNTEIWVSTEIGIFQTTDLGDTWTNTGMTTAGLVAYKFIDIGTDDLPNIITITRKHILRRLGLEGLFSVIADFEDQHKIFDIWTIEHFEGRLYVSTGAGVFVNTMDELLFPNPIEVPFEKTLHGLDDNNFVRVAFGLDVISLGIMDGIEQTRLFIGQENRLMMTTKDHILTIRERFNKTLPTFYVDDKEQLLGYVYNAFNNVLVFREPQPVNVLVTASHIPRRIFVPINDGWAQTNPDAEIFLYINGFPTWLDFVFDEAEILGKLQILQGRLKNVAALDTFNSLFPLSQTTLDAVLADIDKIFTGNEAEGQEGQSLITDETIIKFLDDYTRFISLVTEQYALTNELTIPKILLRGLNPTDRETGTRAEILEEKEDFKADDSTSIGIDTVTGEVDFTVAFANSTDPEVREKFTFDKFDHMQITIFNSNVKNVGTLSHIELEDLMEDVNTGLSSRLAGIAYGDLIKLGIFLESRNNFMFDRFNTQNIQSKYLSAHTNDWYDMLNSTVDFQKLVSIDTIPQGRFTTAFKFFTEDPYFNNKIWIGTDRDIVEYDIDTDGILTLTRTIRPGYGTEPLYVWDIYSQADDEVYVIASEQETGKAHLFLTPDFGGTWVEQDTINLPNEFYQYRIINGNQLITSEEGIFYNDNNFGTWFPATIAPSSTNSDDSPSLEAFKQRVLNINQTTFVIVEADRWFARSSQGLEFVVLSGRAANNDLKTINKLLRFRSLTWIATDKGLYNDGNTLIGSSATLALITNLESTSTRSLNVAINDIVHGQENLYCCGSNGKIYKFSGNLDVEWSRYQVPDLGAIHRIAVIEFTKHYIIAMSYNKIKVIDVTPGSGVFG